jgi:DNA mismatch repair protein MutS
MESMVSAPESDSPASSVMIDETQLNETQPNDMLLNALAEIDPDQLSPRDALDALYRLKRLADDSNTDQ